MRTQHAAMSFKEGLVVTLVHVHQVELCIFTESFFQLYIHILIISGCSPRPERTSIAVGTTATCIIPAHRMDMGEVHFCRRTILTAHHRTFRKGIGCHRLVSPLALRTCGIGIECCQGIGVFHREWRQMIDEGGASFHASTAAESHIRTALGLQEQAHSTFGV